VLLNDHVAEADTNAEPDPALFGHVRLSIDHPALDLDRTPDGNDHEIARAQRSDQLFALLANCQFGAARKHMQDLIAARVKLPRRPPDEARDATGAAAEVKRLDLAWRLLGSPGEITSDHLADGVSAEVMNNHRTFLVLGGSDAPP
jgi:hypothetical protein